MHFRKSRIFRKDRGEREKKDEERKREDRKTITPLAALMYGRELLRVIPHLRVRFPTRRPRDSLLLTCPPRRSSRGELPPRTPPSSLWNFIARSDVMRYVRPPSQAATATGDSQHSHKRIRFSAKTVSYPLRCFFPLSFLYFRE